MTRPTSIRGFTLIEMIVSLGIFSMVMLVATTAYFNLINLDKRARATNEVVNNISFAMEAMMRGIRTGSGFQCVSGTPIGSTWTKCSCFTYTDSNLAKPVTYYLDGITHTIRRAVNNPGACGGGSIITDPLINISRLDFYVRGESSSDSVEPQVLFTVKGDMPADNKGARASFVIEESATQRVIDL